MATSTEKQKAWLESLTPEQMQQFLSLSEVDQRVEIVMATGGGFNDFKDVLPGKSLSDMIMQVAPVALGFAVGGPAGAAAGAGAILGSKAEAKSAREAEIGQQGAISEQRAARDQAREDLMPFTEIGLEAGEQLKSLLADPSQQLDEINPIVDILREQGFEQIQESAAAGGRLGAGGTLKDLTSFNTDLATTVVPQLQQQKFNQLFNLLGIGQNSAAGQGSATLQTSSNIGNALGNIGNIRSDKVIGQANQLTSGLNSIFEASGAFGGFGNNEGGGGGGFQFTQANQGDFNNNLASDAVQF